MGGDVEWWKVGRFNICFWRFSIGSMTIPRCHIDRSILEQAMLTSSHLVTEVPLDLTNYMSAIASLERGLCFASRAEFRTRCFKSGWVDVG